MEAYVLKTLTQFIFPLSFCFLLMIAGALMAIWRKNAGITMIFGGIFLLWISSMPAASSSLTAFFERQYLPAALDDLPNSDAIVVLGGGAGAPTPPRIDIDLTGASDRVRYAAQLYRAGKASTVIASGGGIGMAVTGVAEADSMAVLLGEWGVPSTALITETKSINTHQNALHTKKILAEREWKKILLVTSAIHMPRALHTFRTAGINAIPAPTDYQVLDPRQFSFSDLYPSADALSGTTYALKELLGTYYYRWREWM